MAEVNEIEGVGSKGNAQVNAYQENHRIEAEKKMTLHKMAEKFGLDADLLIKSGISPPQLKDFIREINGNDGSTEFNGEKKASLYSKLGYNIDGLSVHVASHIGQLKGEQTGGSNSDSSNSKGDFVEKAKLFSAVVDPLALAFPDFSTKQKVGGIASAYQKAGVEMIKDGEATEALKTLISLADEIDKDEVLNNLKNNK